MAHRSADLLRPLNNKDFFHTPKHPTANLKPTSVEGDKAIGALTVRGKTQPISIPIDLKEETGYRSPSILSEFGCQRHSQ